MIPAPSIVYFLSRSEQVSESLERAREIAEKFRCSVYVMPSLYDLRSFGRTLNRLRAMREPLLIVSRFPERAMRNLIKKLKIENPSIETVDIGLFDSENAIFEEIEKRLSRFGHFSPNEVPEFEQIEEPTVKRWYPVIDTEACIACLECVNFCLFGVYTIGEGDLPLVDQPDACRDGCPACSRVCPTGAIMFPYYDDRSISGRLTAEETVSNRETESAESLRSKHLEEELDDLVDEIDS